MAKNLDQINKELLEVLSILQKIDAEAKKDDSRKLEFAGVTVAVKELASLHSMLQQLSNDFKAAGAAGEQYSKTVLASLNKIASQKLAGANRLIAGTEKNPQNVSTNIGLSVSQSILIDTIRKDLQELSVQAKTTASDVAKVAQEVTQAAPKAARVPFSPPAGGVLPEPPDDTKSEKEKLEFIRQQTQGITEEVAVIAQRNLLEKEYASILAKETKEAGRDARNTIAAGTRGLRFDRRNQLNQVEDSGTKKQFASDIDDTIKSFTQLAKGETSLERINELLEDARNKILNMGKEIRNAEQLEKQVNQEAKQTAKTMGEAARKDTTGMSAQQLVLQQKINDELDKENKRREKAGILTEQQVTRLKQSERFSKPVASAESHFQGFGVEPQNIQYKVTDYGKTGISTIAAEARTADGAVIKFNQTMDRFGNTIVDIPKRLQGFGDRLRSNVKDFLQWTVLAGTFYTAFQKITEISGLAIDNQEKLADITVALGKAQSDTNKIFEDAYTVSKLTGEGLNGVLEGYSLAYRVTSEYADANERAVVTNKLMVDSLALSKLSTLSQAEALDVLVAGLEQSGAGLENGSILLDKWVAISKQANVDLASLAQAYAIVGKSAENAGLSIEGVAALSAALAKSGVASGKELGNQLRTIISGFQSGGAEKALSKYGIAITDMNGALRTTDSLLREVAEKSRSGIISKTALSEITLAVGGGGRGQQRVAAAIEGYLSELDKINALVASGSFAGSTQEALDIKLETVATSVEKLQNSFQKLAQTIGTDNGLLDVTKGLVDLLTQAIELLDKMASLAGGSFLPMIATVGTALYAGRKNGNNALGSMADRFNTFAYGAMNPLQGSVGVGGQNLSEGGNRFTRFAGNNAFGLIGGAANIGLTAGSNLINGEKEKAAGNVLGGAIGLALGTAATGILGPFGPMLGASIGSTAGEGIISAIENHTFSIEGLLDSPFSDRDTKSTPQTEDELTNRLLSITGGNKFTQAINTGLLNTAGNINAAATGTEFGGLTNLQSFLVSAQLAFDQGKLTDQQYAEVMSTVKEFYNKAPEAISKEQEATQQQYNDSPLADYLANVADKESQRLLELRGKGEIGAAEFTRKTDAADRGVLLAGIPDVLEKLFVGVDPFGPITGELKDAVDVYTKFKLNATQEEQDALNKYLATLTSAEEEIATNQKVLEESTDSKERELASANIVAAEDRIAKALLYGTAMLEGFTSAVGEAIEQFDFTDAFKDFTEGQSAAIYNAAGKILEERLTAQADFDPSDERDADWVKQQLATTEPVTFEFAGGFEKTVEVNRQQLDIATQMREELAKQTGIMQKESVGLGFYEDIPASVLQRVAAASINIRDKIKEDNPNYEGKIEEGIALTADGLTSFKAQQQIMNFLLGQIEENTAKQVEGLYNMPEGASFYFPSSVLPYVGAANQSSGKDYSKIDEMIALLLSGSAAGDGEKLPDYAEEAFKPSEPLAEVAFADTRPTGTEDIPADVWAQIGQEMKGWLGPQTGTTSSKDAEEPTFFDKIQNYFGAALSQGGQGGGGAGMQSLPSVDPGMMKSMDRPEGMMNVKPQLGFKLNMQSNINVNLDGRQIWNAIKPYAREDLFNYEGTSGSMTRNVSVTV